MLQKHNWLNGKNVIRWQLARLELGAEATRTFQAGNSQPRPLRNPQPRTRSEPPLHPNSETFPSTEQNIWNYRYSNVTSLQLLANCHSPVWSRLPRTRAEGADAGVELWPLEWVDLSGRPWAASFHGDHDQAGWRSLGVGGPWIPLEWPKEKSITIPITVPILKYIHKY